MRVRFDGLTPNMRGALWMLLSALTFTLMTTLVKYLGGDYPAPLQAFYRSCAGLLVLLPVIYRHRGAAFATTRPGMLLFRSAVGTLAVMLSFYAYQKMPLADGNALSFTRALWLVPMAAFVVREKVGPLRIIAAVVGFAGVVVMARPGAGGHFALSLPALAMLASAFLLALSVTGMKVMTRDHSPMVLLVWSAMLGVIFSLPGALLTWRWPSLGDVALLSLMGIIATANQACYIKGMQIGDAAAMAPIEYTRLIFSLAIGYCLFHDLPTVWTMLGAAIIVGSTLIITLREIQIARALKRGETP